MFTLVNKLQIENVFADNLKSNNMPYYKMLLMPVEVGNLNCYGIAKDATKLHIGKYSIKDQHEVKLHSFPISDHLLDGLDKRLEYRLKWFVKGYYTVVEHGGGIRLSNMQGIPTFGSY